MHRTSKLLFAAFLLVLMTPIPASHVAALDGGDFWLETGSFAVYQRTRFVAGISPGAVETIDSMMNLTILKRDDAGRTLTFINHTYDGLNWDKRYEPGMNYVNSTFVQPWDDGNVLGDYKWRVFDPTVENNVVINETTRLLNISVLVHHIADKGLTDIADAITTYRSNMTYSLVVLNHTRGTLTWIDRGYDRVAGTSDDSRWTTDNWLATTTADLGIIKNVTLPSPLTIGQTIQRDIHLQLNLTEEFDTTSGATSIQDISATIAFNLTGSTSWSFILRVKTYVKETFNTVIAEKYIEESPLGLGGFIFILLVTVVSLAAIVWRFIIHKPKKVDLVQLALETRPRVGGKGAQAVAETATREKLSKEREQLFMEG